MSVVMRRLCGLLAAVVLVGACGSDVPRDQIAAAAGAGAAVDGSGSVLGAATSGAAGLGSTAGTPGAAGGPAAAGGGSPGSAGAGVSGGDPGAGGGADPAAVVGGCPDPCAPLVLGAVGTWSGIAGQQFLSGLAALRAWVASVNATGGLGGHEVRLEVADDGADPSRHRALVQELVEQRGVVAFVYNAAPFSGQASVSYLEQRRIPVVGGAGTDPWYTTSPMFFSQIIAGDVAIEATTASYARSALAAGMSRMGLITCSDGAQVCEDTQRLVPGYAGRYGVELVYQGEASIASPDFTANCLAARNAGVEILYVALDSNSYQRIGRSCASVGYHPRLGIAQPVMFDELAQDPNLAGSPGVSYTAPFFVDATPGVAEYRAAMAEFVPDVPFTNSGTLGWSAAKLLEAAAGDLSGTPTSAEILEGLWALDGNDLGGLTAPLRFTRDAPTVPAVCYWQVIVVGGQYQSPDGGQRHCEG